MVISTCVNWDAIIVIAFLMFATIFAVTLIRHSD